MRMKNRLFREGGEESPDSAGKDDPQQGCSPARRGSRTVPQRTDRTAVFARPGKGEKVRQELTVQSGDAWD